MAAPVRDRRGASRQSCRQRPQRSLLRHRRPWPKGCVYPWWDLGAEVPDAAVVPAPRPPAPYAGRMNVRLVLADDNLLAREGLTRLLAGVPGIDVVAVCAAYPELMAAVDEHV